ncbi:membrane protein insertion efficiency factor YidD [Blastococcus sp. PRF04-17]|uniref:membrane protein insertion efficiency factor YidD n=1 Tax=Blastococcus sp. PRF04-17 TaxID=2933797 RepID=UPI001FF3F8EB|nr:membrane protein insertion efficiency factor YidD [Blastococcus sp. PRF04-17]UOY00562.1 membrane protein insertion efficiency factor YidD [Blastococcus sp. PRF04-17]
MIRRALLAVVRFYSRAISPALPARCRFHPTCSAYAAEALERHGAARGSWLALRRLLKCAPWHPGGVDLVPDTCAGTGDVRGASSTSAALAPADRARTQRATPDLGRANEESSVA